MKSIFLLILFIFSIISCKGLQDSVIQHSIQNEPTILQYEYIGFEFPDSLAEAAAPLEKLINSLPKDAPTYYIIGGQNIALVRYDSVGNLTERKVYNLSSNEAIHFTYDDSGQYFKNLTNIKDNNSKRMEKGLPSEAKLIKGIKCQKYTIIEEDEKPGNTVYINEEIPIDYYKGMENAPKGVPFFMKWEIMMGISINYGVIDINPEIKDPNSLLSLSTENYIDFDTDYKNELKESGIKNRTAKYSNRQSTYLYNRNDTIVVATPNCSNIIEFNLDINEEKLKLTYITPKRNETTITVSNGPVYDIEIISDSLSSGKYKDIYFDAYSIYFDSRSDSHAFSQTWKTRKKSSFLWESFSKTCLSDKKISQILEEVSEEILQIENPKVFMTSNTELENTPWMMEIARHSFSSRY